MSVESKIRKQVEFYFGDSNLPYDKFLWSLHTKNNGWIPLKTIANFKKMKLLSKDYDVILKALTAEPMDLVEVNADKGEIKRKTEVKESPDFRSRSIYAKGFSLVDEGLEGPEASTKLMELQDQITEYFGHHGKVLSVRLKKESEKPMKFKGSAYIEFDASETADKVAAMDLEFEGDKLETMTRTDYVNMKAEQYKDAPSSRSKRSKTQFNAFRQNPGKFDRNTKSSQAKAGDKRKAEDEPESS